MAYSVQEQILRVASAISGVTTSCCLHYGIFANILRSPLPSTDYDSDPKHAFHAYYDLLRTIVLSNTEDMVYRTSTWLVCRITVPEPVERHFQQGFQRWSVEWIDVVGAGAAVSPTDPALVALQNIPGLREGPSAASEVPGAVRLIAEPGRVSLDIVAQKYARANSGLGTDALIEALRKWGAYTLPAGQ